MTHFPDWTGPEAPALSELPTLDTLEAFDAMRAFLDAYWERGGKSSDDLAVLLSSIERNTSIRPDGGTLDPAQWEDWLQAITTVKHAKAEVCFTPTADVTLWGKFKIDVQSSAKAIYISLREAERADVPFEIGSNLF